MKNHQAIEQAILIPSPITMAGYQLTHVRGIDSETDASADLELQRMIAIYESARAALHPRLALQHGKRVVYWEVKFPANSPHKSGPLSQSPSEAMAKNYYRNKCFPGITITAARGNQNIVGSLLGVKS